jgi:hypothetical protein
VKSSLKSKSPGIRKALRGRFGKYALMLALISCGGNETVESARQERREGKSIEMPEDCLGRYFESDIFHNDSFGRGLSREKMQLEMRDSVEEFYSKSRRGSESAGNYVRFFSSARFSNGELMFPNVAALISGNLFPDGNSKTLAGRRIAKSMRPLRFPNAYALLHSMPKTAVALVDRVNRPGSGMDVSHAEDTAGFFRMLLGFQNRLGAEQPLCEFVPNMSRGQLNEFDSYYSDKIINWDNPVTGQKVCAHCREKIESGDFERFGLTKFPDGMESAFCD